MMELLSEDRSTLGKRLKERRKELGLTQMATSSTMGVPLHTMSKWETGQTRPRLKYVQRILEFLERGTKGSSDPVTGKIK